MINYLLTRKNIFALGSHEFVFSLLIFMDFMGVSVKAFIHDDWANYRWRGMFENNRINNG